MPEQTVRVSLHSNLTRRAFLGTAATLAAGSYLTGQASAEAPAIDMMETKIISVDPQIYHGWPTLTRRSNGELLLVWSGGRETCLPFRPCGLDEIIR
ncbi:MAG: hypothetical protein R3B91_02085 [Planctomycetaceae bacterium]